MAACVPGNTELQAAAAGEAAARAAGAEQITFVVMGTGLRTNTIVGRPSTKIIEAGDMVMAAFAVMYEGYVTTVEWPFVAGAEPTPVQRRFIDALIRAEELALPYLKPGGPANEFVRTVRDHFRAQGLSRLRSLPLDARLRPGRGRVPLSRREQLRCLPARHDGQHRHQPVWPSRSRLQPPRRRFYRHRERLRADVAPHPAVGA